MLGGKREKEGRRWWLDDGLEMVEEEIGVLEWWWWLWGGQLARGGSGQPMAWPVVAD